MNFAAQNRSLRSRLRAKKTRRHGEHRPFAARRATSRPIRAIFSQGVFVPSERPDLPEGAEVILDVRSSSKE